MASAASFQRALISTPTSFLPSVRPGGELPLNADIDVQRWRRMGAGWQTIAANLNCSVDRVRKAYDPAYVPLHVPAEPVAVPRPQGLRVAGQVARNTYQFDILALLDDGPMPRADLARSVRVRPQDYARVIAILLQKRLIVEVRRTQLELTADGRVELARHRCAGDGETRKGSVETQARRRARALDLLRILAKAPNTAPALMERLGYGEGALRALLVDLRAEGDADYVVPSRGGPFMWSVTDKGRAALKAAQ